MVRVVLLATVGVLGSVAPVAAQLLPPAGPFVSPVGYSLRYGWGSFGWGYYWVMVPQPPVVVVRPVIAPQPDFPRDVEPEPVRQDNAVERAAAVARVNAAVEKGDLMVFTPGKPVARAPVPPAQVEDRPRPPAKPAVTLDPPKPPADPKALFQFRLDVGKVAFAAEEYGRARDQFRAAVAAQPDDPRGHLMLSQAHAARGEYAEAVAAIRAGMAVAPQWPALRFRVADLYEDKRERLAEHLAALRRSADPPDASPAARFLFAHQSWFAGDRLAATERFRALRPLVKDAAEIDAFLRAADGR